MKVVAVLLLIIFYSHKSLGFLFSRIDNFSTLIQTDGRITSTQPLQYVSPGIIFGKGVDALKDATVAADVDTALASGIAEAAAGIVGGLASRGFADIIGDKKRDRAILKGAVTGAFFGTRSIIRAVCIVLGVPRLYGLIIASILASSISEILKIYGRFISESSIVKQDSQDIPLVPSNDAVKLLTSETISASEVISDVSKWLIFDSLQQMSPISESESLIIQAFYFFALGSISSIIGNLIKDLTVSSKAGGDSVVISKAIVALEGGILFSIYQVSLQVLSNVMPADVGDKKFLFEQLLEDLQSRIEQAL